MISRKRSSNGERKQKTHITQCPERERRGGGGGVGGRERQQRQTRKCLCVFCVRVCKREADRDFIIAQHCPHLSPGCVSPVITPPPPLPLHPPAPVAALPSPPVATPIAPPPSAAFRCVIGRAKGKDRRGVCVCVRTCVCVCVCEIGTHQFPKKHG